MEKQVILWVNLSASHDTFNFTTKLSAHFNLVNVSDLNGISSIIDEAKPGLICFDFDYPDKDGLSALRDIKQQYPAIPVLMMTEPNSEALAIWALRIRVWDYLTKPVTYDYLLSSIKRCCKNNMPDQSIPIHVRVNGSAKKHSTYPALTYIHNFYHEKVSLNKVAEVCNMEETCFSRTFKKEHKITFREFLMRYRINKAVELLKHYDASVLDVAFAVGFNDPSQFTKMFRRYVNLTPSEFKTDNKLSDSKT